MSAEAYGFVASPDHILNNDGYIFTKIPPPSSGINHAVRLSQHATGTWLRQCRATDADAWHIDSMQPSLVRALRIGCEFDTPLVASDLILELLRRCDETKTNFPVLALYPNSEGNCVVDVRVWHDPACGSYTVLDTDIATDTHTDIGQCRRIIYSSATQRSKLFD